MSAGTTQAYTAAGRDQYNNDLGDKTGITTFSITGGPAASCSGASCSSTQAGSFTVTGTSGAATGTATLNVTPAAAANVNVTLDPATVTADGASTSTLNAS